MAEHTEIGLREYLVTYEQYTGGHMTVIRNIYSPTGVWPDHAAAAFGEYMQFKGDGELVREGLTNCNAIILSRPFVDWKRIEHGTH